MTSKNRPVVFVGSSAEGLSIANALQVNLDHCAELIVWSQGVFGLSEGSLESLVKCLEKFDFAILVLTPDDLTTSREVDASSPRDNVVFELGLFMGALGRARTFIVCDRTAKMKLPSDLAGITPVTYQPPSSAGSLKSALGAGSTLIKDAIEAQGVKLQSGGEAPINLNVQFQVLAGLLDLSALQFILLMHETGITLRRERAYMSGVRYEYSIITKLHHSTGHGFFDVAQLCTRLADADLLTMDLRGNVGLTNRGQDFAKWISTSDYKANYFGSDVGSWGVRPDNLRSPFNTNSPAPSAKPDNSQARLSKFEISDMPPES